MNVKTIFSNKSTMFATVELTAEGFPLNCLKAGQQLTFQGDHFGLEGQPTVEVQILEDFPKLTVEPDAWGGFSEGAVNLEITQTYHCNIVIGEPVC